MCKNEQKPELEPCCEKKSSGAGVAFMKTKSFGDGVMFKQRRAPEQCYL